MRSATAICLSSSGYSGREERKCCASRVHTVASKVYAAVTSGWPRSTLRSGAGSAAPLVSMITRSKRGISPRARRPSRSAGVSCRAPGVGPAKAPGIEQDHVVGGLRDQHVVEADLAELVDDHRGVGERGVLQRLIEERRLAAAEETSEQKNRRHERRLWSPKSSTMASRSQRFAASFSTRACQ